MRVLHTPSILICEYEELSLLDRISNEYVTDWENMVLLFSPLII